MTKTFSNRAAALLILAWPLGALICLGQSAAQDTECSLTVGAFPRTYLLHVPKVHPAESALVMVFHGGGGRSEGMRDITSMDAVADRHGFLVAYPQGLGRVWNDGGSDLGKFPARDDVEFARQLVKDVARQAPVDHREVFAAGFSNGGSFTSRLTLEAPDLIAAGAMVGAGLYVNQRQAHPNPKPMPVLFIEGTDDPCHPYQGGETMGPRMGGIYQGEHHGLCLSADEAISFWCKINGCASKPEVTTLPHITSDHTSTTYKSWAGANTNDVAEYIVQGGGHCWPGGLQYFPVSAIGKTTYDFSASEAIWRFFSQHPRHPDKP